MGDTSIDFLKDEIIREKDKYYDAKKEWEQQLVAQREEYEGKLLLMESRLKKAEELGTRRMLWVHSLKVLICVFEHF